MTFSNRLREARKKMDIDSKDVARAIGVAPSTYSQYETGSREPDVMKIQAISKFLNVSADYLLFGKAREQSNDEFKISEFEKKLIISYREHPEMQSAVNKMLDLDVLEFETDNA